jgi:hypothetical protein
MESLNPMFPLQEETKLKDEDDKIKHLDCEIGKIGQQVQLHTTHLVEGRRLRYKIIGYILDVEAKVGCLSCLVWIVIILLITALVKLYPPP